MSQTLIISNFLNFFSIGLIVFKKTTCMDFIDYYNKIVVNFFFISVEHFETVGNIKKKRLTIIKLNTGCK